MEESKNHSIGEDQKSYRQIIKATSLFGGVQAFSIIIAIIRSKFIAVLLGPTGMGIYGLLTSTTGFIASLTNFGLRTAAVKDVSLAATSENDAEVSKVVTVLRKLVWITGIIGMILTAVLSKWLSEFTFGSEEYTFAFIWISVTLLFDQLSSGQMVVLQGLRKLHYLARANVIGLIIGLLITVPLYYFFRLDGIIPVIIITSFTSMVLSWFFARKVRIEFTKISRYETMALGKKMFKLGFVLSLNGIIVSLVSYLVRAYISNSGSVEQVGLYNSGFTIINMYVGLVFAAMGTDYYPRLSGVAEDNEKSRLLINQQAEVAVLILAPILTVFLVFIYWVIILFYSIKFITISDMIYWAAIGLLFKAASWSIAYIILAKGAFALFFWNELIANFYQFVFNIIGYRFAGLEGLGISYLVGYFLYFIQVYYIAKIKYTFSFNITFYKIAGLQLFICILCFVCVKYLSSPWTYVFGSVFIVISVIHSLRELEKKVGLKEVLSKRPKD